MIYEEAENYHCKKHGWVKWSAMAACLTVVLFTAFSVLPNYFGQQGTTPPDNPNGVIADDPTDTTDDDTTPTTSEIHISLSNLHFNENEGFSDAARIWFDPALYDTIWLDFYHDYYEDGSPKLTEDVAALKGFSITVSKIGLLNDCCYILPENEVKTSDIDGTVVTFGYRSMPYGPYNPDTHEPSGYYDMYVAEFEYDGIEYQIVAEQMEAEEVVKVVSSIIYGEEVIVDK